MTEGEIEQIGLLADKAENYAEYADKSMAALSPAMRLDALGSGMRALCDDLRKLYVVAGGPPWSIPTAWAEAEEA